ncbi:hypothetical protein [Burkholderia cepacia]|uniref:hypothetical protein n=1 Tax=Burkholderia cepacia TaxID=292 RepID=UPI00158DBE20|nr:hypothetical protein [Burkholderia cepacia]
MKPAEINALAEAIASMLVSHGAHGLATGSLEGMGEITLRDGLVVAAAAEAARTRQSWVIEREIVPPGWTDAPVDLYLGRVGNKGVVSTLGGCELKWWRKTDPSNAANRRRDLIRDFIRAASLYALVEEFSFVALLSTEGSWSSTIGTSGTDKAAMSMLSATGSQKWNLKKMIGSKAIEGAMRSLGDKVPMPNIFHTELLCTRSLTDGANVLAFSKVWLVKKPQNTKMLTAAQLAVLIPPKPPKAGTSTVAAQANPPVGV